MAIFSEEGTSYPDILVVCYLSTCFLISTILNPAVFLYNYRKKKNSVPVFLFKCLSVFDFLTCVVIPIKVIIEAVKTDCFVKESDNFPDENIINNSNKSCIDRMKSRQDENANHYIALQLYSLAHWLLLLTPNFIAAMMAICRFIQIKFPFFPLRVKHILPITLLFEVNTLVLSGYAVFNKEPLYSVHLQILASDFDIEANHLVIFIYTWPSILCQILSIFTSLLTVRHLLSIRKKTLAGEATSKTISARSSVKILITNFGNFLNNTSMIACMVFASRKLGNGPEASVALFITSVLAPVLLSCFNPVVFAAFTPEFSLLQKRAHISKAISDEKQH